MRQKNELRPYQDRFATALYENDELLLVARPGFGKTIAALTAITELLRDKVIRHALVIAPKRVATVVWPDEIDSWAHANSLRYAILDDIPSQREFLLTPRLVAQRDVTLIGIDLVPWLVKQLEKLPEGHPMFDLLVIDEASRLRNPTGKRAQALSKLAPRWKMIWGLTGTLRPSGPLDLFMPSRVVTRGKLWGRSFYSWRKKNDSMQRLLFAKIAEGSVTAASAGVATGKLAQLANGFLYDNQGIASLAHDAKRRWLEDLVQDATGPTLLIYEFLEDLKLMHDVIGEIPYLGAGVGDGAAAFAIKLWNEGKLPFMALHPASGGHGLNLQHGGSDMAWMSPTWSPEYWEQTIARINRSGQKKQVVVRVCVASNTVDELKLDRVHHKMTAQEAFEAYLRRWQTQNKTA